MVQLQFTITLLRKKMEENNELKRRLGIHEQTLNNDKQPTQFQKPMSDQMPPPQLP